MAGAKQICNHVIACLYRIEYAHSRGFGNPACTEKACQWNQGTRKDVEPKRITDPVVRKRFRCSSLDNAGIREDTGMKNFNEFDPRIETDRKLNTDHISELIGNIQSVDEHVSLFKSIESLSLTYENNFYNLFVESIANNLLLKRKKCSQWELTVLFLEKMKVSEETIGFAELRSGRLTASKQEIFTKTNSLIDATGPIKPKTTPLVSKIIFNDVKLENPAIKWGIENKENAFKSFYANEISKHSEFKAEKCGLFFSKFHSFTAASSDGIVTCKYHGKSLIKIKCPCSFQDKFISESGKFLSTKNGSVYLLESHNYYTQVISQMGVTDIKECYFVVWTTKDLLVLKISFNKKHYTKEFRNLQIFYRTYVCPALLNFKSITFYGKCDQVLLEESEINSEEETQLSSIECDLCEASFHFKWENVSDLSSETGWICSSCLSSFNHKLNLGSKIYVLVLCFRFIVWNDLTGKHLLKVSNGKIKM